MSDKPYSWICLVNFLLKYYHYLIFLLIYLVVYAYVWHAFLIAHVIYNVAPGILWQATEVFPWSLSQVCFTVLRNCVFVFTFGYH